jgi:hypothetical protein
MIRRGFWLTAGVVTGIYGYRRVSAVGRRLSASLTPGASLPHGTSLTQGASVKPRVQSAGTGAMRLAKQTYRFTRDVREGMELYRLSHSAPAGSTLSTDRTLSRDRTLSTDHTDRHDQPKDGH